MNIACLSETIPDNWLPSRSSFYSEILRNTLMRSNI